jgi:hypothetical protein
LKNNIFPLLTPSRTYNHAGAYAIVHEALIQRLPGEEWNTKE